MVAGKQGRVCKWVQQRGFGFVEPDDGGHDVFVHISACPDGVDDLSVGTRVAYDIEITDGKPRAVNVAILAAQRG